MPRSLLVLLGILFLFPAAATKAQNPNTISTVAGGASNPTTATSAFLPLPRAAVRDAQGNTYISAPGLNIVYKVDTTGKLTAYAGTGFGGFSGDGGPAVQAQLSFPEGLAIDGKGVLFIADTLNNRIRRVDTNGNITTVAGSEDPGSGAFAGDNGLATSARLAFPSGVAVDQNEDLFIADTGNSLVRRVDGTTQVITTYAGSQSAAAGCPSGAATAAGFAQPVGVAVDTTGNVFIADAALDIVCKVDPATKNISTYAGTLNNPGAPGGANGDGGPATSAQVSAPNGLAVDSLGDLLITDSGNPKIRMVNVKTQIITTIAGSGFICGNAAERACGDGGPAASASFDFPRGVFVDSSGNIVVADTYNMRVRVISAGANPPINALAGGGSGGDGAAATSAVLGVAQTLTVDANENIFALETDGERLRKIDTKGTITTFAGLGVGGSTRGTNINGDNGPATNARFVRPSGVSVDSNGNFYIVDATAAVVRKIDTTGTITTIAGNGMPCGAPGNPNTFPTCGGENVAATSASLANPSGVAVDLTGNVYISDIALNTIRVVSGGNIRTFAGKPGQSCNTFPTNCGDGGSPTSALLNTPEGVATAASVQFQGANDVFIADSGDNVIRKIDGELGTISTVAFNGNPGFGGDGGPATEAEMNFPEQIAVDSAENLYIGGGNDNVVRRVDQQDQSVITVAGDVNNLDGGFSGDGGLSTQAMIINFGLAVFNTAQGTHDLFIADSGSSRIRKVNLTPVMSFISPASGSTLQFLPTIAGTPQEAVQEVTFENTGLDDLIVTVTSPTSPSAFQLGVNCLPSGVAPCKVIVPPQGFGFVEVVFSPPAGAAGTQTGTLSFTTNDPANKSFTYNLSGPVAAPITLNVSVTQPGNGTVFSTPGAIACDSTTTFAQCSAPFPTGATVTLFTSPKSGFAFQSWNVANAPDASKCASDTTGSCTFTMTLSESIGANFGPAPPPPSFTVTVNPVGNGSGMITSTPAGISCTYSGSGSPTGTCSFSFPVLTPVMLTPSTTGTVSGSVFAGWLGQFCAISPQGVCTLSGITTTVAPVFSGPAKPFAKGQVFLSTDDGMVFVYNPDGSFAQILNSTGLTQNPGNGLAFDPVGNLYVANQGSALVELFGNQGTAPVAFGSGNTTPFSVVVDPSSNVFVGQTVSQGDKLLEYAGGKTGAPSSTFFPAYESDFSQAAWTELRSDGDTVLYTLGTKTVKVFDIADLIQLPDVVTNLHGAFALRELPDQTVLVADTDRIVRLDLTGNVTQTYTIPGAAAVFSNLNLDPDGVTFWTDDQATGTVYRLNIASGAVASQFNTPLGIATIQASTGIGGIAVSGAAQAGAGADLGISMTAAPNPVASGSNLTYSITVTNNGPDSAQGVSATDALPAGVTFVSATPSTGSCSGTATVTCNLGTFANGATATISIVVTPTAAGTLTNTVNVTSTTPDPVTANNSATTSTTVTGSSAPATHFSVTAPANATAGMAFNVTVTALTATNTTATGYTGTVHFTSSDAQAVLPADSTLTNGTGMFSATLKTAGAQMITATDTVTATITGTSGTITVGASAAATHFSVTAPANATAGTAFNVTVTALTATNTTATGYTGTVHFTSSDAQAVLPADSTLTNGTGTFSVTLKTAGAQMITATDTVTATIMGSATVTVTTTTPPTLVSITVTPNPATVAVGGTIQFTATGHFSDGTTKDITNNSNWSSSDTAVATINTETGLATGVAVSDGAITITATAVGTEISGTAQLTVSNVPIQLTIPPPPGGTFGPVNPGGTLPVGVVLTANPGTTGTVTFSCTVTTPTGAAVNTITCQPDPSSVNLTANGPTQVALVVNTFCRGVSAAGIAIPSGPGGGLALLLLSSLLAGLIWAARRNPGWALSFALFLLIALGGVGCSSMPKGANGATQPGDYQLVISATINGQTVSAAPITFHVN